MEAKVGIREDVDRVLRDDPPEAGDYLVGFVVIAEYLHSDGQRSLARVESEDMTAWQRTGYLYDAIEGEGWDG